MSGINILCLENKELEFRISRLKYLIFINNFSMSDQLLLLFESQFPQIQLY